VAPVIWARQLTALRSALTWWRERGWIVGNPVVG